MIPRIRLLVYDDGMSGCRSFPVRTPERSTFALMQSIRGYAILFLLAPFLFAHAPGAPRAYFVGKVVDERGKGMPRILVRPLVRNYSQGKPYYLPLSGAFTDESGSYDLLLLDADLPAKMYLFAEEYDPQSPVFRAPSPHERDVRSVRTFYPSAATRQEATLIEAEPGVHSGFEIHMRTTRTYQVEGALGGDLPGDGSDARYVFLALPDDQAFLRGSAAFPLKKDRTFEISGVAPGAYEVIAEKEGQWPDIHRCSPVIRVGSADLKGIRVQCTRAWK